jgi:hypothetical protein
VKTSSENARLLPVLIAALGVLLDGRVTAQTFNVLHSFSGDDGAAPKAGLVSSSNVLYGTTSSGGDGTNGTVRAITLRHVIAA